MQRLPMYQDLHPRVRGVPHNFSRLRDTSRSPSPSPAIPFRDRSFSIRSASSAPPQPAQPRYERLHPPIVSLRNAGSTMHNGNDGWTVPDYSMMVEAASYTTTLSEATSSSDDRMYDTPATADVDMASGRGLEDGFAIDKSNQMTQSKLSHEPPRLVPPTRNGNFESLMHHVDSQLGETLISPNTAKRSERQNRNAGGLGIQFGEHEMRRPSLKAEENLSAKPARTAPATANTEITSDQQPLIPPPLLSPVREVRTPSPTAKRREGAQNQTQRTNERVATKLDLHIPAFADLKRAKQEKRAGTLEQKPNGVSSAHPGENSRWDQLPQLSTTAQHSQGRNANHMLDESPLGTVHPLQTNGWQQQSGRKGKKNKSRPSSGQFPGEQMPLNEAERKGG